VTQPAQTPAVPLSGEFAPGLPAFNRSSTVTVGTKQITNVGQERGLRVSFNVKRTLKAKEPNTANLKIWNLAPSSLAALATSTQKSTIIGAPPTGIPNALGVPVQIIPVQIDAGYVGQVSTIFLGEMRSAQTVTDGPDTVTELNTGDGDVALQLQRINAQFLPGTTPLAVVQALLAQMGVGIGNLATIKPTLTSAQGTLFAKGLIKKGNPARILADICSSLALEFSIQNGAAQFASLGQPLAGQAVKLTPGSGLIGSPTVDTAGIMSCVSLVLPGLAPGLPLQVQSEFVSGTYRILSVEYTGDTWGTDWYCKIEAASPGIAP
jgi:hypothetical protein